jgi:hypothetical protein
MPTTEKVRYGRLVAQWPSGRIHVGKRPTMRIVWLCLCDCGNLANISMSALRSGNTKSCGCLRIERGVRLGTGQTNTLRHGHSSSIFRTRTYQSWRGMINRCTSPSCNGYKYYGGQGIKICERWGKFENFLADMGERPEGKTIDRFPDPYGNYEPENCRWATYKEQNANQRKRTRKPHVAP